MTQIRRNFLAITVLLAAAYGCSSDSGSSENMDSGSKTASRGETITTVSMSTVAVSMAENAANTEKNTRTRVPIDCVKTPLLRR